MWQLKNLKSHIWLSFWAHIILLLESIAFSQLLVYKKYKRKEKLKGTRYKQLAKSNMESILPQRLEKFLTLFTNSGVQK